MPQSFEKYLLNLNKKILIISDANFNFNSQLILRNEIISNKSVFYINNDIQYGSKYISKRMLDIFSILLFSVILIPVALITYLYILIIDLLTLESCRHQALIVRSEIFYYWG